MLAAAAAAAGAGSARAADFSGGGITIPAAGPATPYPSTVAVSGLESSMRGLTVTVDIDHGCMFEAELLLVGPRGQRVLLMADASDCPGRPNRSVFTFDDASPKGLSCHGLVDDPSGRYRPTDCEIPGDPSESPLPYPAPGEPYASALSVFNGTNPNGAWSLYVNDADQLGAGDGRIAGWRLSIDAARIALPTPSLPRTGVLAGCARGRRVITLTSRDDVRRGTARADLIFAGAGNDVVNALAGNDCVDLGAGNDRGTGGRGADRIDGKAGRDRIAGSSGKDRIEGGGAADSLRGNSGSDRIRGGRGRDRLSGGSGNDSISARDRRRDRISCGRGRDRVSADRFDRVAADCEKVRRR